MWLDFLARRSPRLRELDSDPRDRDPPQGGSFNIAAFDVVDVKFQPYNRVRAVFLRLADQLPHSCKPIRLAARSIGPAPLGPPP